MAVISRCIEPGCTTLCIGLFCIAHDAPPQIEFPRGRPWPPVGAAQASPTVAPPAHPFEPTPVLTGVTPISPAV